MNRWITRAAGLLLALGALAAQGQVIPTLDIGCATLSYRAADGRLLVTDRGGRVFVGTFAAPLQTLISTAGDVNQARFVAGGRKILLVYRSGALELLEGDAYDAVIGVLPAYSYSDVRVSHDGRWVVGLTLDRTAVDVIDMASGQFNKVFTYQHPMFALMALGQMSTTQPLVPLIVDGDIRFLDAQRRIVLPGPQDGPVKGLRDVSVVDDQMWLSVDAGLMPLGEARPLQGRARKEVQGVPMIRSAYLRPAADDWYVASDDLGFSDVLKRSSDRSRLAFETVGKLRLVPQLTDVVADTSKNAIAFCGSHLQIGALDSGEVWQMEGAKARSSVYVENMTNDASLSIIRDFEGRTAIWDNRAERFAEMIPRLQLQVFPSFGALHQKTKAYLSLGQPDVVTLARLSKPSANGVAPGYKTEAIPLPPAGPNEGVWNTVIAFGAVDSYEAFIARGQAISRLTWPDVADAPASLVRNFINVGPSNETCSAFEGRIATSPTGHHLAVACRGGVAVFDLRQRRRVAFASAPEWAQAGERFKVWTPSMTFSSDGRLLVFGIRTQRMYVDQDVSDASQKPAVYVFDWETNRLQALHTADGVPITAVTISPDQRQIWVGGYWGSLCAIDRQTGRVTRQFRGVHGHVFGIGFDREGYANVWTDSGSITRFSTTAVDHSPSTVSFLSGALVRKTGLGQPPANDLSREFSIVRFLINWKYPRHGTPVCPCRSQRGGISRRVRERGNLWIVLLTDSNMSHHDATGIAHPGCR